MKITIRRKTMTLEMALDIEALGLPAITGGLLQVRAAVIRHQYGWTLIVQSDNWRQYEIWGGQGYQYGRRDIDDMFHEIAESGVAAQEEIVVLHRPDPVGLSSL